MVRLGRPMLQPRQSGVFADAVGGREQRGWIVPKTGQPSGPEPR